MIQNGGVTPEPTRRLPVIRNGGVTPEPTRRLPVIRNGGVTLEPSQRSMGARPQWRGAATPAMDDADDRVLWYLRGVCAPADSPGYVARVFCSLAGYVSCIFEFRFGVATANTFGVCLLKRTMSLIFGLCRGIYAILDTRLPQSP